MSLTAALNSASSGLLAAQVALSAVSDNIANVNTPGYARKTVTQAASPSGGVLVTGSVRVIDAYLQSTSLNATAEATRWSTVSSYLDRAQALFGDPSSDTGVFSGLDEIFAAFTSLANDPSSTLLRSDALASVSDVLADADRITEQLVALQDAVDSEIGTSLQQANSLLEQIANLNGDISRAKAGGADASGSENLQSQLLDELAGLMDVKVAARAAGGVEIRSGSGILLAGDKAAVLSYDPTGGGPVLVQTDGAASPQTLTIASGALRGLLDLGATDLPGLSEQVAVFADAIVDQLNAAHNAATATPPPTVLSGKDVGTDLASALSGFTGSTTLVLVDPATNTTTKAIEIDFETATISVDGDAGIPFTGADFLDQLNVALGGSASASFTDGRLTLKSAGDGLAIAPGDADRAGQGFSAAFGLNDLVVRDGEAYAVRPDIAADPGLLAAGVVDAATVGAVSVAPGDGRGASALASFGSATVDIPAAGLLGDMTTTLSDYAAQIGGAIGRAAATAQTRSESAEAVATQATSARQSVEGVNLDEELVSLTTYQQAYAASAKLIQAISDMFDELLKIV